MHEEIRSYLVHLVATVLGITPITVAVSHAVEADGRHTFSIGVPPEVRGLLLGPEGKHARALETLAKMRALRLDWRGRINVRVRKNG